MPPLPAVQFWTADSTLGGNIEKGLGWDVGRGKCGLQLRQLRLWQNIVEIYNSIVIYTQPTSSHVHIVTNHTHDLRLHNNSFKVKTPLSSSHRHVIITDSPAWPHRHFVTLRLPPHYHDIFRSICFGTFSLPYFLYRSVRHFHLVPNPPIAHFYHL